MLAQVIEVSAPAPGRRLSSQKNGAMMRYSANSRMIQRNSCIHNAAAVRPRT